jgi:RNA polymerase sigma-70 factor (ECF subfamily)
VTQEELGADGPGRPPRIQAAVEAAIDAALAGARRAFPTLGIDDARLQAALRLRVAREEDPIAALHAIETDEVVLADACALGDTGALAIFEARYLPDVRATLGRVGLRDAGVDDAVQALREDLLVGAAGALPRIVGYAGRGKLRGWLRAVATRTGMRILRQAQGHAPLDDDGAAAAASAEDLELAYLKKTYGSPFKDALRAAFEALPAPDRLLLKQRLAHGMSAAAIGALHGVHPSTASRWVADARERLVAATRDEMMRRLEAGRAEVSSILRLIQSELDITLTTASEAEHGDLPR